MARGRPGASAAQRGAKAPRRSRRASPRLSQGDWIAAGQAVLCEAGIAGLRLSELTRRLRVSTGSFYHHFADMEAYLTALASHFSRADVKRILDRAAEGASSPLSRIRRLAAISLDTTIFQLDRAMRVWATSDARAAAGVKASEKLVLAFLTEAFADLGFEPGDAALRAHLLLSANVALIGAFRLSGNRELFKRSLELLTRDAPALAGQARSPVRLVHSG